MAVFPGATGQIVQRLFYDADDLIGNLCLYVARRGSDHNGRPKKRDNERGLRRKDALGRV
jgi:hypothetical protein